MFNNPVNYELYKSLQEDLQIDEKQRQGASFISTLVKIAAVTGSLLVVAIVLAEHLIA